MTDLVVLGLKLAFLAVLWLFVLYAVHIVRSDLFGRRVPAESLAPQAPTPAVAAPVAPAPVPAAQPAPARSRRFGGGRRSGAGPALSVVEGPQTGLVVPIGAGLLIGRTADAGLVLDDQFMSTRHALVTPVRRGVRVEDLGSTNGTFVNDQRVSGAVDARVGDTVRIGRTVLVVGDAP